MNYRNRAFSWSFFLPSTFCAVAALALALPAAAQTYPAAPKSPATAAPAAPTDKDVADTQEQLLKLLRLSPVLTTVMAHDPSLLADPAYVARNNPELAQYIASHPDIARNPEFYLFSHLSQGGGRRDQALERAVWPDLVPPDRPEAQGAKIAGVMVPIIIVPAFFLALFLIFRLFVQSDRWNRAFKQQSEIHARLIDKLGTSQDLAAYMETEAGKRFLTMSPMALGPESSMHMPNAVARVLTPLQAGIVMTLLGIGLLLLRHAGPGMETPMVVLGTLALMPGIGFILSAGVTWVLARRLGLMPDQPAAQVEAARLSSSQDNR